MENENISSVIGTVNIIDKRNQQHTINGNTRIYKNTERDSDGDGDSIILSWSQA
jgi:hypothetical protein